ncbi:MAG: DnaJ domain-containing protein [Chitinophagales bacterium]
MANKFSFSNLIDSVSRLIAEEQVQQKKLSPQQQSHQQEIENAILVLSAEVIRCDKNFTEDTEKFIHEFLQRQFGRGNKKHRTDSVSHHIETGTEPYTKIACKELKLLTTHDSRISIIRFLFGIAAADDFVNAKETRVIHRISGYLGISEKDFKEVKYAVLQNNNPYYALDIDEDASWEQIKQAYRRMVLKHHPDKREHHITEEEATQRFRGIQRAFEIIKQQMGKE